MPAFSLLVSNAPWSSVAKQTHLPSPPRKSLSPNRVETIAALRNRHFTAWLVQCLFVCLPVAFTLTAAPMAIAQETNSRPAEKQVREAANAPTDLFEPREFVGEGGESLQYRLLKPADFDPDKKYPLVIFLHGAGERGDDNKAQLKHGMANFCTPEARSKYPCYVLAPQCPMGQRWADVDWSADAIAMNPDASESMKLTLALVDSMLEDAAIDPQRIYITGLSMGGFGTWDAIARRPEFFAAALPICGGADTSTAMKVKDIPISCFHGDEDRSVKVELSRTMIEALKAAGGAPKYTEYPGVGHDSWTATYANPDVLAWLFSQRRASSSP